MEGGMLCSQQDGLTLGRLNLRSDAVADFFQQQRVPLPGRKLGGDFCQILIGVFLGF